MSVCGHEWDRATRRIVHTHPGILVMVLSMHSDRRFVIEALNAGARGYLLKDSAYEELLQGIQTVVDGEFFLSPKVAGRVIQDYIRRTPVPTDTAFSLLTTREREVLQLIAEGKSTKEIAFTSPEHQEPWNPGPTDHETLKISMWQNSPNMHPRRLTSLTDAGPQ